MLTSFNCRLLKSNCLDSSTSLPWTIEKYNKQTRQTRKSTTLIFFFFSKRKKEIFTNCIYASEKKLLSKFNAINFIKHFYLYGNKFKFSWLHFMIALKWGVCSLRFLLQLFMLCNFSLYIYINLTLLCFKFVLW